MSIPTPFSINLPLTATPFKSRVESNLNFAKNYYAVAFKPGFPLQASELNEIQEIFYVQQTLNNQLRTTGWTGAVPWTGCTPLDKTQVTMGLTGDVTVGSGWYMAQDSQINGGLGVWFYNDADKTFTPTHTETTSGSVPNYGLVLQNVVIQCNQNGNPGTNEDITLQDQSNYNVIGGPCGAARMKLDVIKAGSTAASGQYVLPILSGPRSIIDGSGAVVQRTITFVNGDVKTVNAS